MFLLSREAKIDKVKEEEQFVYLLQHIQREAIIHLLCYFVTGMLVFELIFLYMLLLLVPTGTDNSDLLLISSYVGISKKINRILLRCRSTLVLYRHMYVRY